MKNVVELIVIGLVLIAIAVGFTDPCRRDKPEDIGFTESEINAEAVYGNMSDNDRMEGVVLEP